MKARRAGLRFSCRPQSRPFDPDSLPNLDIFSVYRLYSVAGLDQGRVMHALRLGFFSDEIAANTVASYLTAFYQSVDRETSERRRTRAICRSMLRSTQGRRRYGSACGDRDHRRPGGSRSPRREPPHPLQKSVDPPGAPPKALKRAAGSDLERSRRAAPCDAELAQGPFPAFLYTRLAARRNTGWRSMMGEAKREVLAWVDDHLSQLSDWHDVIWHFAEPAFREYKSSAWYVELSARRRLHGGGRLRRNADRLRRILREWPGTDHRRVRRIRRGARQLPGRQPPRANRGAACRSTPRDTPIRIRRSASARSAAPSR